MLLNFYYIYQLALAVLSLNNAAENAQLTYSLLGELWLTAAATR